MDICRIDFCSIDPTEPTLNNIKKHKNCLGGKNPKNFVTIQSQTVLISTRNQNTILYLQDRNSERKRIG